MARKGYCQVIPCDQRAVARSLVGLPVCLPHGEMLGGYTLLPEFASLARLSLANSARRTERANGCVTNFPHGAPKFTIWKHGDRFTAREFGVFGETLPIEGDPVFQALAQELHRLACEVGKLRRIEIEDDRRDRKVKLVRESIERQLAGPDSADDWWRAFLTDLLTELPAPKPAGEA